MTEKEKDNLELRSEEVQEILNTPPAWIVRWGITLIFIFTCMIFFLMFLIKYPDFVSAKIIVTTEQPTESVISRYSGSLAQVYISNGDSVNRGQNLAVIRNTANIQDVIRLKRTIDSIPFSINEFRFPIDSTSQLSLGDIETAYIEFERNYVDYNLSKELKPYVGKLLSNKKSLVELKNRLYNLIKQRDLSEQEFKLKKNDFERNKKIFEKGVISQQEYERNKMEFIQMQRNLTAMAVSISQLREAISSGDQTIKATKINRKEDATHLLKNLSQSYNTLKKSVNDWEYRYVLTASINGTVSYQAFWGINQHVNSGETVFSILPTDTSNLVGKLLISSQNSGKVTLGQKVLVKLDNFPYHQYGILIGKVKSISISPNDDGNYFVYISLPNGTLTSYNKKLPFDQELIGNAEIITEDLSVAERIFYKLKNIFH